VDQGTLQTSYEKLRADAAVDVDKVSKAQYGEKLGERLKELHERLVTQRWRHQPLRRVEIPKDDWKTRAIGIRTVEDKVV